MDLLAVLASGELGRKTVPVPEWNQGEATCILEVREMTVLERSRWRELSFERAGENEKNEPLYRWSSARSDAAMIALGTRYAEGPKAGQRVFSDEQIDLILALPGQKHAPAIARLTDALNEVNFTSAGAVKVALKNSAKTRSSSTSPRRRTAPAKASVT